VLDTGSATTASAVGIRNDGGASLLVRDNVVGGVQSNSLAVGIFSTGRSSVIQDNRITGVVGGGSGVRGISVSQASSTVRGNHIQVKPGTAGFAVRVNDYGDAGQAICTHNIALGFAGATPLGTCFDFYNSAY
jgi:hypothetical protein